jgi:hypothetical protein
MIVGCKDKVYEQRLEKLGLTSLETRHYRADMIQVFKVLEDKKNIFPEGFLTLAEREGRTDSKNLYKKRNSLEVSRNSFTSRVVDKWNYLPEAVVSAADANNFKCKLDKYMRDVRGRIKVCLVPVLLPPVGSIVVGGGKAHMCKITNCSGEPKNIPNIDGRHQKN